MPSRARRLAAVVLGLALGAPARAQRLPTLTVALPVISRVTSEGPVIRAIDMLAGARIRELLTAGFPARFHFRVELWSEGRWFNDLERRAEYDVLVRYIALEKAYDVVQVVDERPFSLGRFARVDDAESAIARPTRVPIIAFPSRRRMYYLTRLDVEVLSISDLDEVQRWLRGELQPAMSGDRNPGTAFTRGFRTLATRLLGGEKRGYEARTPTFSVP